jgi:hypothetical protein
LKQPAVRPPEEKINSTHVIEPYSKCTKPSVATGTTRNFAKGREALQYKT